ncbi:hypothetical protein NDU88_006126 [Pleurodeles waltl]|uniref:Uncharacterized protein n=1 Tax=Pleurodeles waltl TaxID=8319 RepID=A0AAV7MYE1_PLEWA|nr:hypothetical protein NDU88_006126 [Pleurodeles waltl]
MVQPIGAVLGAVLGFMGWYVGSLGLLYVNGGHFKLSPFCGDTVVGLVGKGCTGGEFMYRRLEQVEAETENGHMTDENGWEENMTRELQIGRGWTVAGLRR